MVALDLITNTYPLDLLTRLTLNKTAPVESAVASLICNFLY